MGIRRSWLETNTIYARRPIGLFKAEIIVFDTIQIGKSQTIMLHTVTSFM